MFQEFFKDTLMSRFIKRLLRATNIPLFHVVNNGSILVQGCFYIYKDFIIECVTGGVFTMDPSAISPSNELYPKDALGNPAIATYKVINYYDETDKVSHYNYHSKFMYYDSETHYHLGEYLRYIRDTQDLNLMPYYNCYNNKSLNKVYLGPASTDNDATIEDLRTFKIGNNSDYKVLAVPVKFGHTYTIALDSTTPVHLRTLIYNDITGCVLKDALAAEVEYYSDDVDDYQCLPRTLFNEPFTWTVKSAATKDLFNQEKNLYLVLQVSTSNTSALTVLEGNYVNSWKHPISNAEAPQDWHLFKNLSLLHFNSHTSYAFSDRLIEYLLLNIVNKTETIDQNIGYVQELLREFNTNYSYTYKNIWNDNIREYIGAVEDTALTKTFLRDLDGYLNKDIEKYLLNNKGDV